MSQRTQGIVCIALGVASLIFDVLSEVLGPRSDSIRASTTVGLAVAGIALIAVGVLRIRGKISK